MNENFEDNKSFDFSSILDNEDMNNNLTKEKSLFHPKIINNQIQKNKEANKDITKNISFKDVSLFQSNNLEELEKYLKDSNVDSYYEDNENKNIRNENNNINPNKYEVYLDSLCQKSQFQENSKLNQGNIELSNDNYIEQIEKILDGIDTDIVNDKKQNKYVKNKKSKICSVF